MTEKRRSKASVPGVDTKMNPLNSTLTKQEHAPVAMQDLLGEKLRAYYDEVAHEPVPDRFDKLLKELEARSNPQKPE